jgi:hypothetical protein
MSADFELQHFGHPSEPGAPGHQKWLAENRPSITCPDCGRTSHNPNDVREGYCGACHAWTSTVVPDDEYVRMTGTGYLLSDKALADIMEANQ